MTQARGHHGQNSDSQESHLDVAQREEGPSSCPITAGAGQDEGADVLGCCSSLDTGTLFAPRVSHSIGSH